MALGNRQDSQNAFTAERGASRDNTEERKKVRELFLLISALPLLAPRSAVNAF